MATDRMIPDFSSLLEKTLSPYEEKEMRVPFYLTSSDREMRGISGVSMLMNPTQISFRQTKRISVRDTQGGKVFIHWTNEKGMNNDILEMEFSGQTGNINTRYGTAQSGILTSESNPIKWFNDMATPSSNDVEFDALKAVIRGSEYTASGAAKLANFHNLYSLTREPVIDRVNGFPIYYYISYSSPLFGNTFVTFVGHFSRVLDFADDASEPFNKFYNFGFTVMSSYPSLDNLYGVVTQNLSREFLNPIDRPI